MAKLNGIYKCEICGNTVTVINEGAAPLVCCGQNMTLLEEKTKEQEGNEKHVPIVEIEGNNVKVKVGSIPHPMEEKHYIGLIQLMKDENVVAGKRLNAGDKPEASFCLDNTEGITARIWCNIHGLWIN